MNAVGIEQDVSELAEQPGFQSQVSSCTVLSIG